MSEILHLRPEEMPAQHTEHQGFAYTRRVLVPMDEHQCTASLYEIPPGKAAYPYHYHTRHEEVFYILSGSGVLRSPQGERPVQAGDVLFFPTGAQGAHQLSNNGSEVLRYLDFDTHHEIDVAVYPDSGKIGVWGSGINQVFRSCDAVGYYEGEAH